MSRLRAERHPLGSLAALALAVAALAGGCAGPASKPTPTPGKTPPGDDGAPRLRQFERPYIGHIEAIEKQYFSGFQFPAGFEHIAAPVHSGVHATIYYYASRGTLARHIARRHEESLLVVGGSGKLLLGGGKSVVLEPGILARIPPGAARGFVGNARDPLRALLLVTPAVENDDYELGDDDLPGTAEPWIADVTSPDLLPALPAQPDSVVVRKEIHRTAFSTLQVAAVRRDGIPDHKHLGHDETAFIFAQEGLGFERLEEVVHIVQEGQLMHIPAGAVHSFQHQAEGHARAISIFTPGYDGKDFVLVDEKGEVKAPPGYKLTRRDEFIEKGSPRSAPPERAPPRPDAPGGPEPR